MNPTVSILISTFNRSQLLPRAINSVLSQTLSDLELVIIDDCSQDNTKEVVKKFTDKRIRYYQNKTNVGSAYGDRAHMRRFVYDLMQGKYFLYLCDDDYLLSKDLLERQVTAFEIFENLSMAIGGQLSHYITDKESLLGGTYEKPGCVYVDTLPNYFDFINKKSLTRHMHFMSGDQAGQSLFSNHFMTSEQFLTEFSSAPTSKNLIVGATLYSREKFILCGGFADQNGSKWQAGYELLLGPATVGDVVYFNEPAIVTEIREKNASFQRTQLEHYMDSVLSIDKAFERPLRLEHLKHDRNKLIRYRGLALRNLSRSFLSNTITIKKTGQLGMCSAENISLPVDSKIVIATLFRRQAITLIRTRDILLLILSSLPSKLLRFCLTKIPNAYLIENFARGELNIKSKIKSLLIS